MTIALPAYRSASTKFAGRSFQVVTRWGYNPWLARVDQKYDSDFKSTQTQKFSSTSAFRPLTSRAYATTAHPRLPSRAKASTTKTPAKRTTKAPAKKPGPKTAAGKKKVGRKPKTKPVAKKATRAPATRAKRPPTKHALAQKRIADERALKEKALLDAPKPLPSSPWSIIFAEHHKKNQTLAESNAATKEASLKYRNLTPEEKEHYNHESHIAKEKNLKAFNQWLSQFTPEQIREANNARVQLKKKRMAAGPRKHHTKKFIPLKDDRLVRQPSSSFIYFTKERHASGDFANMKIAESAKLIGREWKALDNKKPFEDQARADRNRYEEEHRSVYGKAPGSTSKKSG